MKLVFASNNKHKIREINSILGNSFILVSLDDINITEDIPEIQTEPGEKKVKEAITGYLNYSVGELETLMNEAIRNEDYEKASIIRDEIKRRNEDKF